MSRLVIVSNRVGPVRDSARAGGLAVAIVEALRESGGLWFGWSGEISEQGTHGPLKTETVGRIDLTTIDIDAEDYRLHYAGYTNRTLWPVFHYRLDLAEFEREWLDGYYAVNERFAARLYPLLRPDDIVWIHDYHFLPLAAQLRAMGAEQPIGFFLHIPFPVPEILTALPSHRRLVRAMLSCDLIGFQTDRDRRSFERYLLEEEEATATAGGRIRAHGRTITAAAFPVGIDAESFSRFAVSADAQRQVDRLAALLGDRLQIIGVDRLDYSKGLVERFRAYGELLENYPENRGRVSLLQIAPPSREELDAYIEIRQELERIAGNINGRYADFDWTPIRYITRGFQRRTLAGLYRASRVGLVTPLRDGMNLVAKEYVAAQDGEDPGVLVLSRFAGAAEALDGALIVNPYNVEGTAEVLQRAVQMSLTERRDRWSRLNQAVHRQDAASWRERFLTVLRNVRRE
jgi:trehalose 6-phosphate synthase